MRLRLLTFLVLISALIFGLVLWRQYLRRGDFSPEFWVDKKVKVLTYSSFVSSTGPANELFRQFEKKHNIKLDVTSVSDAGLLLERLKLGAFDVVIGLDQLMLESAEAQEWQAVEVNTETWHGVPAQALSKNFVPYDWSPMSFVYRQEGGRVPEKFDDLQKSQWPQQFAVQDPRQSTPGLQFYQWVKTLKGDKTSEFLKNFKANVHSVAPNWTFSYGLFEKKQVRFVFSYLTSLAFHWGVQNDRSFNILNFSEGHPVQIEFAAVPASCQECDLAQDLVQFLLLPTSQQILMLKNFMLPVIAGLEKGSIYAELPQLKTLSIRSDRDLDDWDKVFKK